MAYSNREIDMQQERKVVAFIQQYVFPHLYDNAEFIEDLERQLQGIDVIIYDNNFTENLDIKAQASARYINNPVPTFVHELLYTNKSKKDEIGWFLKDLETDTYVFVWIHAAKVNERGLLEEPQDIIDMELMFVDKVPLTEYLDSKGYTSDVLLERAQKMRKIGLYKKMSVLDESDDDEMWLTYSAELRERPVNLVIKKRVLKKFSTKHIRATKSGVFDIVNDII